MQPLFCKKFNFFIIFLKNRINTGVSRDKTLFKLPQKLFFKNKLIDFGKYFLIIGRDFIQI